MFPVTTVAGGNAFGAPDVCKTPSPAGTVPIPYPSAAQLANGSGAKKVKVENSEVLRKGDKINRSTGMNAGAAGGVVGGSIMEQCEIMTGWPQVRVEGKQVGYQTVVLTMNKRNLPCGVAASPGQTKVKVSIAFSSDVSQTQPGGALNNPAVRDWLHCSETLRAQLQHMQNSGVPVERHATSPTAYYPPGLDVPHLPPGSNVTGRIVLRNGDVAGGPGSVLGYLAHEIGHVIYQRVEGPPVPAAPPPGTPPTTSGSRWVGENLRTHLDDEGAATLNNAVVRNEVEQNCEGRDVPFCSNSATNPRQYQAIANDGSLTGEERIHRLGRLYGQGELAQLPSTTYAQYYSQGYRAFVQANPGLFRP